jgi:hypothetical protein
MQRTSLGVGADQAEVDDIRAHRAALLAAAEDFGLSRLRVRDDGALVVRASRPGYESVLRFAAHAAALVGAYVHVLTDDVPAAGRHSVDL